MRYMKILFLALIMASMTTLIRGADKPAIADESKGRAFIRGVFAGFTFPASRALLRLSYLTETVFNEEVEQRYIQQLQALVSKQPQEVQKAFGTGATLGLGATGMVISVFVVFSLKRLLGPSIDLLGPLLGPCVILLGEAMVGIVWIRIVTTGLQTFDQVSRSDN
jgi:hypothetical protein